MSPMRQESLVSLLARWEAALERGQELSPEELCGRSELIEPLRQAIEAYRCIGQLAAVDNPEETQPPVARTGNTAGPLPPLPDGSGPAEGAGPPCPPGYEVVREL